MTVVSCSSAYCNCFSAQSYMNKLLRSVSKPDGEMIVILLFKRNRGRIWQWLTEEKENPGHWEASSMNIFFQQQRLLRRFLPNLLLITCSSSYITCHDPDQESLKTELLLLELLGSTGSDKSWLFKLTWDCVCVYVCMCAIFYFCYWKFSW